MAAIWCRKVFPKSLLRTHFINRREMRSFQKGHWQGVRRVAWWCHAQGVQRGQRPFWKEPGGSVLFGRIAALRIGVKTSSLDPDSRLALHPKQGKLAFTPIYEMSSSCYPACRCMRCPAYVLNLCSGRLGRIIPKRNYLKIEFSA